MSAALTGSPTYHDPYGPPSGSWGQYQVVGEQTCPSSYAKTQPPSLGAQFTQPTGGL